jgi:hypothetical protein
MLSDQSTGVHYNDSSKLVGEQNSKNFVHILRGNKPEKAKHDQATSYTYDYFPADLNKKVDLFKNFSKYLV